MKKKTVIKLVLLGNSNVGKTSVMSRFTSNEFRSIHKATIGADFASKRVDLNLCGVGRDNKVDVVDLQIWDTAGQEKFQSLSKSFYRNADACILVYDNSNDEKEELKGIINWIDHFRKNSDYHFSFLNLDIDKYLVSTEIDFSRNKNNFGNSENNFKINSNLVQDCLFIAGNKIDISNKENTFVSNFCKFNGIRHFRVSALKGEGVEGMFKKVAEVVSSRVKNGDEIDELEEFIPKGDGDSYCLDRKKGNSNSCC